VTTANPAHQGPADRHGATRVLRSGNLGAPVIAGVIIGAVQVASAPVFWWVPAATVYALELVLIAAVYIGFSVADGRWKVIAVECGVAGTFVIIAAAAITASPWLLVAGYVGHGLKDLWQHHSHFVANTRWWPPFCATIDLLVAAVLAAGIATNILSA
jgi:hypothetical protein